MAKFEDGTRDWILTLTMDDGTQKFIIVRAKDQAGAHERARQLHPMARGIAVAAKPW
jgi:hypothetical protein